MAFPKTRMRRLRATAGLRGLVRETELGAGRFMLPLFVMDASVSASDREPIAPGRGAGLCVLPLCVVAAGVAAAGREPIPAMPGVERLSISAAVAEAGEAAA